MSIILGLNFGHDGSVCLVKDGKLEFAITTERLTKVKKQHGFTDEVIHHVLESTNTKLDDIDCVATNDFKQEVFGNEYLVDIFNVLGKEIAILINEEKPAGEYEVGFTGKNLPSGIYFYQLKSGSFIESKKMILLK